MPVRRRAGALLASPLAILLALGVIVPAGVLFVYSFYETGQAFRPQPAFDLGSYETVLTDPTYRDFFFNTIVIALPTMAISVAGGFAIGYYLVFHAGRDRIPILALVVISMMGSYLVRMYAWRTLLGENGIINSGLESVGIIQDPLSFLIFNRGAVIAAEVNFFMPFSALVFYATLSGVAPQIRDAAHDLGAGAAQTLRRIILPLAGRAMLGAAAFTFFLSCADYITPVLLGGNNSTTFGTLISDQLRTTGDYPLGAALSFVLVAVFVVVFLLLAGAMRLAGLLPKDAGDATT